MRTVVSRYRIVALLFILCFATVIDVGAGLLLAKPNQSVQLRVLLALLPVPANLILITVIVGTIRKLDEFLRHVHLEAIAVGFLLTGLAVFIYGYLEKAKVVQSLNVGMVWIFMVLFYGIGYVIASKHYR